jgi:hypothetical protein
MINRLPWHSCCYLVLYDTCGYGACGSALIHPLMIPGGDMSG